MEAIVQLCNEVNEDCWVNIPGTAQAIGNYAESLAQLLYNGTGANLSGSYLTSFSGLNSNLKAYIEYMNEYWNGSFSQFSLTVMMGTPLYGTNYAEWYGSQVAGIGDTFYNVYGSSAFGSRVVVSMSQQSSNTYWLQLIMNTPDWTSRAYTHHIGAIHTGGYFGLDSLTQNSTDLTNFLALSSTAQVNCYFTLAYSNTCGSTTFSSIPSNGYIGQIETITANDIAAVSTQPWADLPRVVYEGGSSNSYYGAAGSQTAYLSFLISAHRDPRTQFLYFDPNHALSPLGTGYFAAMGRAGISNVNIFSDVNSITSGGDYGTLESIMQSLLPLSSAPPKYQGIMSFVASTGSTTSITSTPTPSPPTNLTVH